jgi:hypothetical protein
MAEGFPGRIHTRTFRGFSCHGSVFGEAAGIHPPGNPRGGFNRNSGLRTGPSVYALDAPSIVELAKDYLHSDSSYAVRAHWDLWVFEGDPPRWQQSPQPVELLCNGEDYDDSFWKENGHFEVNFGFEHLFTGHGGLLGIRQIARPAPQSAEEANFLESMSKPPNLQIYQEKTRENIKSLFAWVRRIENAWPVERLRLWSEGEENFEARLEEILAAR